MGPRKRSKPNPRLGAESQDQPETQNPEVRAGEEPTSPTEPLTAEDKVKNAEDPPHTEDGSTTTVSIL